MRVWGTDEAEAGCVLCGPIKCGRTVSEMVVWRGEECDEAAVLLPFPGSVARAEPVTVVEEHMALTLRLA